MKKGGNFARRDRLLEIQREAQKKWSSEKRFERNLDTSKPKFMVTFPYPYMNGRLHLGHAFSLSKPEFIVRFKQMCGYNALFPFGFHCTGMPISAASKRLKEELENHGQEKLINWSNNPKAEGRPEKKTQWEILKMCEVEDKDMPSFADETFWCKYFPPKGKEDIIEFGIASDFRRSMITTDLNPYYDKFIRWQFNKLKQGNFVKFGKRPSIFSIKDNQMCADHDRAEGEGVGPQEYTLIKILLIDEEKKKGISCVSEKDEVFLVAATLRPETMYGQTNCFILPEGEYGVFRMKSGEVWVCSDKSALNMSYQDMFEEEGKPNKLGTVKGMHLIGSKIKAPLTSYEYVYVLPMLSISMDKGTGVVTSVPSDAPDDFAVLREFQKKKPLREKFGLTDEMVMNFNPIEIIDVPGYSKLSAKKAVEEMKINSMNDKAKLQLAKELVYNKGFYEGIMMVGECKGKTVEEAKPIVKAQMIEKGEAVKYFEPEKKVVSRSGDECVVALCDQWYINYGKKEQLEKLKEYVQSSDFNGYAQNVIKMFVTTLDWLKEWGCSRTFGMGTRLPWDEQYLIESLSDSTIYMAYYTISHFLQGNISGTEPGSLGIKSDQLSDKEFDYIFLGIDNGEELMIEKSKMDTMRESFLYWYPYDLRCSAKDLIKNHLTMSLYNHEFVFNTFATDKETRNYLPKGYFLNGYVNIDNQKMSKSLGNFFSLREIVDKYSADAVRLTLASGGDTIEDANIIMKDFDNSILKLTTLEQWIEEHFGLMDQMREESNSETEFFDKVFENQMNELVIESFEAYEKMLFRDVLKNVFFNFLSIKEEYLINCGNHGMRKNLFQRYLLNQIAMLSPLTPHFSEIMYDNYLKTLMEKKCFSEFESVPENINEVPFPRVDLKDLDISILKRYRYLQKVSNSIRGSYDKIKKKKKDGTIKNVNVLVRADYLDWQKDVMNYFNSKEIEFNEKGKCVSPEWQKEFKDIYTGDKKPLMKKSMEYGNYILSQYKLEGKQVFDVNQTINEKSLLEENKNFIFKDISGDFGFVIRNAGELSQEEEKKLGKFLTSCVPLNPYIYFDFLTK